MPRYTLTVNGKKRPVDVDADTPLLWVLRDTLGLTGTKYGCGQSLCGACTVHLDGEPIRSCVTTVADAARGSVTTIEEVMSTPRNPIRRAWIAEDVPQCGYCQPGMIMTVSALLAKNAKPGDEDIDAALAGHICRCGTYQRIRRAVHRAARSGSPLSRQAETPGGATPPKKTPAGNPPPETKPPNQPPGGGDR